MATMTHLIPTVKTLTKIKHKKILVALKKAKYSQTTF